jgi:hypothetical protein
VDSVDSVDSVETRWMEPKTRDWQEPVDETATLPRLAGSNPSSAPTVQLRGSGCIVPGR